MDSVSVAMNAWRDADEEARAAENLLVRVWHDYAARTGPAVSQGLVDDVARLRDRANDKLMVALSLLRR